jgi:CRISPR-associated protein Csb3
MSESSIPVDLLNPGQVFACLGFLEVADVLLGDATGGFDWSDEANVRFRMRAGSDENPFAVVLKFIAEAEVYRCGPTGYSDPLPTPKKKALGDDDDEENSSAGTDLVIFDVFPDREGDRLTLPIQLTIPTGPSVSLSHWADGTNRNTFKLYSGNRSAHGIARDMLHGKRGKPKKKQQVGDVKTHGIDSLWKSSCDDLTKDPFNVVTLMGGSFNFDPRAGWTALDAGYSPNTQKHGLSASPVVEFLAACGLEHARPDEYETRQVRYGAWCGLAPLTLARPALAGINVGIPVRRFHFTLDLSGKNKVVTFAQYEEKTQ